jgi:hypothetical protein
MRKLLLAALLLAVVSFGAAADDAERDERINEWIAQHRYPTPASLLGPVVGCHDKADLLRIMHAASEAEDVQAAAITLAHASGYIAKAKCRVLQDLYVHQLAGEEGQLALIRLGPSNQVGDRYWTKVFLKHPRQTGGCFIMPTGNFGTAHFRYRLVQMPYCDSDDDGCQCDPKLEGKTFPFAD